MWLRTAGPPSWRLVRSCIRGKYQTLSTKTLPWIATKSYIHQKCQILFSRKYLLYTNTGMMVALIAFGDVIQQNIELISNCKQKYDAMRTSRMMLFASFSAPIQHLWYLSLDKFILKGNAYQIVGKKIIADQVIFAPFFIIYFFVGKCANILLHFQAIT